MTSSILGRHPLFASVALICVPLALQIVAVGGAVPEDMWLVFVLSVWASLTTCVLVLSVLFGVVARVLTTPRFRQPTGRGILRAVSSPAK